jgi:hypothetical protein
MKSKELIRLLQEEDPSGEVEVSVGNRDIFSLHTEPSYWDGRAQLLIRDYSKDPYYNVVGAKYTSRGSKVVITAMGVTDAILNNPDLPVDYSEVGNEDTAKRYTVKPTTKPARKYATLNSRWRWKHFTTGSRKKWMRFVPEKTVVLKQTSFIGTPH